MNLTMIIATRGRPKLLLETVNHTIPNISRPDTQLLICVDEDDKPTIECLPRLPTTQVIVSVKPREDTRGAKYNRALTEARADLYLPAVDYAPILTPGFDQAFINGAWMFPDGIGCVFSPMADDLVARLQAVTAGLAEKLGFIYNPDYPYWFIDHELDDIAKMIDRFVFVDVDVSCVKRPAKTIGLRDLVFWTSYYDAMTPWRQGKAREIIDSVEFEAPQWMKGMLRDRYRHIEARSVVRHNGVRRDAQVLEAMRGDCVMEFNEDEYRADPVGHVQAVHRTMRPPTASYLRALKTAENKLITLRAELEARELARRAA